MRLYLLAALTSALAVASCGQDQDKLDDNAIAEASGGATTASDRRCSSGAAHEAAKRELFRRAAELRGSNAREYEQVAGYALLLVEDAAPVEPAGPRESVDCRGRATLSLPPGLKVAGGRTRLAADIIFNLAPGGAVTLGDADALVVPLATLTRARAAASPARPAPAAADPLAPSPEAAAPIPSPAPAPVPTAAPAAGSSPSFNCAQARTRGEIAVCADPTLAALDRAMAAQYRAALAAASPAQAQLLRTTRDAFLGYRDRCPDDACVATTYRGRMREIADIAAGRWRGR